MNLEGLGLVDCDVHPTVPTVRDLLPYLDDYWAELVTMRGMDRTLLNLNSYPATNPFTVRPDWKPQTGRAGADPSDYLERVMKPLGIGAAILNPLHGAAVLHSEDMAAGLCSAVNRWVSEHWLDRDPRLRASIVVPLDDADLAVAEIERCATDPRFVQVLMLASGSAPLGKRRFWPIYEAATRHGLTIGVHAGSAYRFPTAPIGWSSTFLEDYVHNAQAFESQMISFIAEGVLAKFPELKIVFIESGFMWVPAAIWRANKTWRGVRPEVPWVKENPGDIVRRHFRFTLQPVDEPPGARQLEIAMEQLGSDELLLFSTDYPHWHFDGLEAIPPAMPAAFADKLRARNAISTYPRLGATIVQETVT